MTLTFVEKYADPIPHKLWTDDHRPQTLDEVVGNEMIVDTLKSYLKSDHLPNLILCGGHGCAKTTIAKLLAEQYLGKFIKTCYLEVIGSIYRGKNVVTEKYDKKKSTDKSSDCPNIVNFITKSVTDQARRKCKIVCIYDFDCMTSEAQMALRRIIELYADRVRFIFICNNLNNVIEAIQSRTLTLKFNTMGIDIVVDRLKQIAELNQVTLDENMYQTIAMITSGDLKQSINYLQVFSRCREKTLDNFYRIFNIPSLTTVKTLIDHCLSHRGSEAFNILNILIEDGYNTSDVLDIIIKVLSYSRDITEKQRVACIEEAAKVICINENTPSVTHLYRLVTKFSDRA